MNIHRRLVQAIEDADRMDYSIQLTRLVDGEATYTLTFGDGLETLEFPSAEEAREHLHKVRLDAIVDRVLAVMAGEGSEA